MHDGAEGHERLHHARCGPAPLVLPLRPFGRPLGSVLRAHGLWEPDRARVPDRRMSTQLRPASSLSPGERVDLFNAAYVDYFIPFRLDEPALDAMTTSFDLDVDASRVALADGEPIGFGNLGLRGDQAWIGGVGVVVPARRQGIAEALMRALHDEAAARGVTNVWLEVMEQNDAAYRLYEKLGYRIVREVEVWSLPADTSGGSAREMSADGARARVRELRRERDGSVAVFRVSTAVQLLQIAGDDAADLLRTLRGHGTVSVLNLPADDPAADSLRGLGATPSVRQREMVLDLQGQG